jgi:hypothetical protein
MRRIISLTAALSVLGTVATAAQAPDQSRRVDDARAAAERRMEDVRLKESRYQIGQMERLLEGAVEHGATVIKDRLAALMPSDMLLTENARARGFRLEGYGVFFDVAVPSLTGTLPWSFMTLNQNNLGLDSALRTVRSFVESAAANDVNVQQALRRIELGVSAGSPAAADVEPRTVSSNSSPASPPQAAAPQGFSTLNEINESYRSEIRDALIDAMLEHSRGLSIPAGESLTVAARGIDDRPRLAPADTDSRTVLFTVKGSDLSAFLAGQITRDEARQRVEMRVF